MANEISNVDINEKIKGILDNPDPNNMASSSEPIGDVIKRRLEKLKKKHRYINALETQLEEGKELNEDQKVLVNSKPTVVARIEELQNLLSHVPENDVVLHLLRLIYLGRLFDPKQPSELASWSLNVERDCFRDSILSTSDYVPEGNSDLIADLKQIIFSCSTPTHIKCIQHASKWLAGSDRPIAPHSGVTYRALRDELNFLLSPGEAPQVSTLGSLVNSAASPPKPSQPLDQKAVELTKEISNLETNLMGRHIRTHTRTDETLALYPRVIQVYDIVECGPHTRLNESDYTLDFRLILSDFTPPVHVDIQDIQTTWIAKKEVVQNSNGESHLGEVAVLVRDLSFIDYNGDDMIYDIHQRARQYLSEKFPYMILEQYGARFEFRLRKELRSSEDAFGMLLQFALVNPGYWSVCNKNPPVITLRMASHWFVQPNASGLIDEHLKALFSVFGKIRYSVISNDTVNKDQCSFMVQYEDILDFYAALKSVCVSSLLKGFSSEMMNFEVELSTTNCFPVTDDGGFGDSHVQRG